MVSLKTIRGAESLTKGFNFLPQPTRKVFEVIPGLKSRDGTVLKGSAWESFGNQERNSSRSLADLICSMPLFMLRLFTEANTPRDYLHCACEGNNK